MLICILVASDVVKHLGLPPLLIELIVCSEWGINKIEYSMWFYFKREKLCRYITT